MLELMALNWFDLTTIGLSFFTIITVQIINSIYGLTTVATTAITNRNKLSKQISEQNKNVSSAETTSISVSSTSLSPSSLSTTSSPLTNRHSISCIISSNKDYIPHTHEDEDTLSLENLFPGDQTAIYESKRISYIIDELIETEGNYVKNLKKGLQHYGSLQQHENLPVGLKGADKQEKLLGNRTKSDCSPGGNSMDKVLVLCLTCEDFKKERRTRECDDKWHLMAHGKR
uniref:DH domain-containing protein n=1 Tax=Glossina austeni TaxID=7395 RepID=A0A1A9UGY2_GLOAU